jgi:hypothetical protein
MWADAHAKRQEDSMGGIKFKPAVKAAPVADAMLAAPAAIAFASAPSAEAAATKVGGSMERALRFRSRVTRFAVGIAAVLGLVVGGVGLLGSQAASAGTNGQQVSVYNPHGGMNIYICGYNQNNSWVCYPYSYLPYGGRVSTYGWWWKGGVYIYEYNYNNQFMRMGQSCYSPQVNNPPSNNWAPTCYTT